MSTILWRRARDVQLSNSKAAPTSEGNRPRVSKARGPLTLFAVSTALCFSEWSVDRARATIITFNINSTFSGDSPVASAPWIKIQLNDHGGTGSVDLSISAIGLTGTESLSELCLNLDPSLDPTNLVFSAP